MPKPIREAAGISAGAELEIRVTEGRIEIEPAPLEVKLVKRGALTVAVPRKRVPALSQEVVRRTLERVRRRGGENE